MPTNTDPEAPRRAGQPAEALGGTVARGMSFMVAVALFGKALSTVSTLVLGLLLTDHDYGLYGLALGVSGVLAVLRDGGLRQVAIQRGPAGFRRLVGPVGWLSLAVNAAAGLALALVAPLAGIAYGQATLVPMLLITALSLPMITIGSIARADLEVQMRYGDLAIMTAWNNVTRYASMVTLAALGFGPFAFVVPNLLVAVVDGVIGVRMVGHTFLRLRPRVGIWRVLMGRAKWTISGTLGLAVLDRGDYAVLGLFISAPAVGLYTFAYQIAIQVNTVLSANFQRILLPTLVRFAGQPERHRAAIRRSTRSLSLVSSTGGIGLACIFPSFEALVWNGKWAGAVLPVQLMCLALPMRMCIAIHNAAAQSRALFRSWANFNWLQGLGLVVVAVGAGLFVRGDEDIARVAAWVTGMIGAYYAFVIPAMIAGRLRVFGLSMPATLGSIYLPWLLAVLPGLGVLAAQRWLGGIAPAQSRAEHAAWLVAAGAAFMIVNTALVRLVLPATASDLVGILPGRLRRPARTVLRLPRVEPPTPAPPPSTDPPMR